MRGESDVRIGGEGMIGHEGMIGCWGMFGHEWMTSGEGTIGP